MAIAWVFPGQGSQKVGMAEALLSIDGTRERFAMASELLGRDLLAICQGESGGGDGLDDLNDTRNTQPALFVIESVLADNLQQQGREPALVAGHSLGELVALYSAGVFGLETGLQLMKTRSELMANAGGGAMTAVIGFDRAQLDDLVAATDGVSIANDNSDAQVVIALLQIITGHHILILTFTLLLITKMLRLTLSWLKIISMPRNLFGIEFMIS